LEKGKRGGAHEGVHLGGVEEVDAGVKGGVEEAHRARRPVLLPHRHRPCKDAIRPSRVSQRKATERERESAGPKQRRETGGRSGASCKVGVAPRFVWLRALGFVLSMVPL
jgi:hypothetical protein